MRFSQREFTAEFLAARLDRAEAGGDVSFDFSICFVKHIEIYCIFRT